jgi:hypothetical protein
MTGVLEPSLLEFSADIIKEEIKERVRVSFACGPQDPSV